MARPRIVRAPVESALEALGTLVPGGRVVGLTKGQFSLIDLVLAVLDQTGPAELDVSTWVAGADDLDTLRAWRASGKVSRLRLIVGQGFAKLMDAEGADHGDQRRVAAAKRLPPEDVRAARSHAKFAVIWGTDMSVLITSSGNFNRNDR